jgi:hypothetical protein
MLLSHFSEQGLEIPYLAELAPVTGCRGFTGPIPPPLSMSGANVSPRVQSFYHKSCPINSCTIALPGL